jgi:hypothetical protein
VKIGESDALMKKLAAEVIGTLRLAFAILPRGGAAP